MAYGNNRALQKPRSSTKSAGGVIFLYRHPFLVGTIGDSPTLDEIDVSSALQLNATFFNAAPLQANAVMEPLVDGSTIMITNNTLAGRATLQVMPTSGIVGLGDLIAAAQIVIASKDHLGGTLTVKEPIQGRIRTTVFYGVGWENVPHLILAGNAVVPYPMVMLYSGWIQGVSKGGDNVRAIWAVGNKYGLKKEFEPYSIQDYGTPAANSSFDYGPLTTIDGSTTLVDAVSGDIQDPAERTGEGWAEGWPAAPAAAPAVAS